MAEPDPVFSHPRLAALYDVFDDDRSDLDAYTSMVDEFGAASVLDIGCGTGAFLVRLAASRPDLDPTGIDPAAASLDVARSKPFADRIRWILGGACELVEASPPVAVDLAVMTGNVAQVFVTDPDWRDALAGAATTVRSGGVFVVETRDPSARAWERWTPSLTHQERSIPGIGDVEMHTEVIAATLPMVTFESRFRFPDGEQVTSVSTLRFRSDAEIRHDLDLTGFDVVDRRDAPDRPGLEWVFVCRRR